MKNTRVLLIYLEPLDNEHMGLMCVGTVLEKAGHFVKIIGVERQDKENKLLKEISDFKPDIIGLSIITSLASKAQSVANFIKKNFPKRVWGMLFPHYEKANPLARELALCFHACFPWEREGHRLR